MQTYKRVSGEHGADNNDPRTVESRQRLLDAAMTSGSRSRFGRGRDGRRQSSRLRIDAVEHIALAARSTGAASRTVDAARDHKKVIDDTINLGDCLRTLAHRTTIIQAELLDVLSRFDAAEGWRVDGAKNCIRWMCSELGVGRSLAYSQLFVARKLCELPIIAALFRDGELSWSKVQALTRIATAEDERALAIMALDHDAIVVQQICDEYRWGKSGSTADDDAARDRERFERRSLTWSKLPDGSLAFRAVLPPDMAGNFLACLEHQESLEYQREQVAGASNAEESPKTSGAQRRADALVSMGEASLVAGGDGASSADRFQVVVHVDADALEQSAVDLARRAGAGSVRAGNECDQCDGAEFDEVRVGPGVAASSSSGESSTGADDLEHFSINPEDNPGAGPGAEPDTASTPETPLPLPIRAAIAGVGGISPSMARRLACDGSLVTMIMKNGEPLSVGRKTRRWSPATRRAILARDGSCTFPGCGSTRNLDVHHVHGWALGGETSVATGTALCRSCHVRVHDEGWDIQRVSQDAPLDRHPEAERLLAGADERTRDITRVLDARRSTFRFERKPAAEAGA